MEACKIPLKVVMLIFHGQFFGKTKGGIYTSSMRELSVRSFRWTWHYEETTGPGLTAAMVIKDICPAVRVPCHTMHPVTGRNTEIP